MAEERSVVVERDDGVLHVILDRPEARNALDLPMCEALSDVFREVDADNDVRAVILRGNGRSFCAGADLKERQGKSNGWIRNRRLAAFAAYELIERCSRPVVGLLQGPVVGSGGEIALCCDFAIAADDFTLQFPEPHWGTVGATQRLQRAVGKRHAKDVLFTKRTLSAQEALDLGVVTRVVARGDLSAEGNRIAGAIKAAAPLATALTKQAIDLGAETDLRTGIHIELAAIERNLADGDAQAGVDRFADTLARNKTADSDAV